jgi:nucleoside-diphosphate-sugar epimerase
VRIAIAGINGFLGTNYSASLNEDFSAIQIKKKNHPSLAIENSDVVINFAGKAHDIRNGSDASVYFQANTEYNTQLFNAFLVSKAKVFIYISSVKAVADSIDFPLTEGAEPFPQTHYGKSKLLAEYYINSKKIPAGKRVYILRPCMIHGPGNKGNLNLLYKLAKWGFPWPLAAFENKRSFCSVENICFVINELITRDDIPSGIYNVADDEPLSTNEVIEILGESMGKKPRFWQIPRFIIHMIARLGDMIHLPLNTERLTKLTESYVVSNKKLVDALGKSLPVKAKDGLKLTFESFK